MTLPDFNRAMKSNDDYAEGDKLALRVARHRTATNEYGHFDLPWLLHVVFGDRAHRFWFLLGPLPLSFSELIGPLLVLVIRRWALQQRTTKTEGDRPTNKTDGGRSPKQVSS